MKKTKKTYHIHPLGGGQRVFCRYAAAVIQNAGHVGRRIFHRIVILPDYQGMGIGTRFLAAVAKIEARRGKKISIRTSHPALIRSLAHSCHWRLNQKIKGGHQPSLKIKKDGRPAGSPCRFTVGFDWRC